MPRFFFHVYNGHGDTLDEAGSELESQAAARQLAVDSVRSMVSEDARRGVIDLEGRIDVKDTSDNLLLRVEFVQAFDVRVPPEPDRTGE